MARILPLEGMPEEAKAPAYAVLMTILGWTPRCVHVVAEAGVFDALGDEPETAAALAKRTGCNPDALERILRLLASVDIFELRPDGRYAHNAVSRCYSASGVINAGDIARLQGSPLFRAAAANFGECLRTGGSSLTKFAPKGAWAHFTKHRKDGRLFDAAMSNQSTTTNEAVIEAYDFSGFRRIADVGGGTGSTLRAILKQAPKAKGVLFDLRKVVKGAPKHKRVKAVGGDFFKRAPKRADAYVLKYILHDWPDDRARRILRAIRKAAKRGAKLVVVEAPRPDTTDFHVSKLMDVSMMALFGGRERTIDEFSALFDKAGFKLTRTIPTAIPVATIIEAEAV